MTDARTTTLAIALLWLTSAPASAASLLKQPSAAISCVEISEFYGQISAESEAWQAQLRERLRDPQSPCARLKLGLLLSHPVARFQNDADALDQLSLALLSLADEAVDKRTLSMLIDHIEERQALRNMLGSNSRRLRRKQAHIDTLRGQIDQLKNLETELEDKAREAIAPAADALAIEESPAPSPERAPATQ